VLFALIAAVSFLLSFFLTYLVPATAFYSLPTRAWQLAVGGLIALTALSWQRLGATSAAVLAWTGLALILLAYVWLDPSTLYPGTAALLPTLGAALVIAAGCARPEQGCGRLLALPPMRAIGRVSYSWYLWHWPVLVLAPFALGHQLSLPARLLAVLLSAGLAWATLHFLENPLRFAPRIRTSPRHSLTLGAVATAIAVAVGIGLLKVVPTPVGHGLPAKPLKFAAAVVPPGSGLVEYDVAVRDAFAQVQAAVAGSADLQAVPSNLTPSLAEAWGQRDAMAFDGCLRQPFETGQPECAMGETASKTTIALVGDSHAAMWTPAFLDVAAQRQWRLEMLAKGACPMLDLPITNPLSRLANFLGRCSEWREGILGRLEAEQPQLIVVSLWRGYGTGEALSGYRAYNGDWTDGITRLVQRLRATGAQVMVLGPIPDPHFVVPVCLSGYLDDVPACTPQRSTAVNEAGIAAEAAATEAGGGQYVDTTELFCTTKRCPVIVGNTLVYLDSTHATLDYTRLLAPAIGALVDRALADHDSG
jgi:hypothetical protein